jgi:hypothetical protein
MTADEYAKWYKDKNGTDLTDDQWGAISFGCIGVVAMMSSPDPLHGPYQTDHPELADGVQAYLQPGDAKARTCPDGFENFIFAKQGVWRGGHKPKPGPGGIIPKDSVDPLPGKIPNNFNYVVLHPNGCYSWMNHADFGDPNQPQRFYFNSGGLPTLGSWPATMWCSILVKRK